MSAIHPTALVNDAAILGSNVNIGPYCIIGENITLGDGVNLVSHVVVDGVTTVGENTVVYPFASLGSPPQDLKYNGEPSRLEIGCNNCLFMVGSHVAHDCMIDDHVILVNNATLGGHVQIAEWAIIGGLSAIHQFVRIGRHAMVGGMSGIENDIIPYGSVIGNRARLQGLNIVGLKRRDFSRDVIHSLR
ncbi:MAG: acyl-ACP--UDP-N-acetylglucosamine O-acyltransferase, partial [Rhodospirillales bacterium]